MIYSTFQKRPGLSYLLLGLVFVIGVAEVVLAGIGIFPDRYDWILGFMLFGTVLAWMCAAALAGVVAPISNTVMKYANGVLAALPLPFLVFMVAAIPYPNLDTSSSWLIYLSLIIGPIVLVWMTLAGLAGSLAPRDINARAYVPLIISPLLAGIVVLVFVLDSQLSSAFIPRMAWEYKQPTLFGLYGLATFLLFRQFLVRLKWTRWPQSGALFVLVVVTTIALAILVLWGIGWIHWVRNLWKLALFGVLILAPFGIVTLRTRDFKVGILALGITMASYCVIAILALQVGFRFLQLGGLMFMYILAGIVASIPAGYLISEMRHPYRNVLVAAIGPGLTMMMIMCLYWFVFLGKAY